MSDANELRHMEYEEQAAVHMLRHMAAEVPAAAEALTAAAEALIAGAMFDEDGIERTEDGADAGVLLVLEERAQAATGSDAAVLRTAAYYVRDSEHLKYHPEHEG